MPIVRRTDCIKPRVVFAWLCWLRLCGARVTAPHNKHLYLCRLLVLSSPTFSEFIELLGNSKKANHRKTPQNSANETGEYKQRLQAKETQLQ
jgi:hypothetical protein